MITTGKIGDTILITGSGLYAISSVIFSNNASGNFSEVNRSLIVSIPEQSAWGPVLISSQERNVSGYSSFWFVPEPVITGFTPNEGVPGDSISIKGFSMSGVTGVTFNNLSSSSVTVNSTSGISATVPTGNTRGYIKVIGASGLYHISSNVFSPLSVITGLSSYSVRTGDAFTISGHNFLPQIMYEDSSIDNNFFISFNGATGSFGLVNSQKLTGIIPPDASSGPVNILRTISSSYTSNYSINVIPSLPLISRVTPSSGNINDGVTVEGLHFNNVNRIRLKKGASFVDISGSNSFVSSSLQNVLFFNIPTGLGEGRHDIVIYASGGEVTGSSGILVRYPPSITGFSPPYALPNQTLRISGLNMYGDSLVYLNSTDSPPLNIISGSYDNTYIDVSTPGQSSLFNTLFIDNKNTISYYTGGYLPFIEQPRISGFYPTSGYWGDTINVSGTGFSFVDSLYVANLTGLISGQFSIIGDTGISFVIPTGSYDSYIRVNNIYSSGISSSVLNVLDPSGIITGFTPAITFAGQQLTISGVYLNRITGVLFSGWSGLFSTSDFRINSGNNIVVSIPYGAVTNRVMLKNESATSTSANELIILQPPVITGVDRPYSRHREQIRISGYNFSGNQFYFKKYNGGFVEGTGTQIINSILATTYIPHSIVTSNIVVSGTNGKFPSSYMFYPQPLINSIESNIVTGSNIGDYIVIQAYNGTEITGLMLSGNGIIMGIIDKYSDLGFNYDMDPPLVTITGYLNGQFFGSGNLYPIWSGWTGFSQNVSDPFSGSKFLTSNIDITGGLVTISGTSQEQDISYDQILSISGTNLRRVSGVMISGSLFGITGFQSFDYISDKLITGKIGLVPNQPISPASLILQNFSGNYITHSNTFNYYQNMLFTYFSKNLQGQSVFTGTSILVSGSHFQGLPGSFAHTGFLRNYSNTNVPVYIHGKNSDFSIGASLNTEHFRFDIPNDQTLTDQVFDLVLLDNAGGTGIVSGVKISNYSNTKNLDEIETKIYIFSSPS